MSLLDARMTHGVEMRDFGGLTEDEIASALGVTTRTVRRDWEKARSLLGEVLPLASGLSALFWSRWPPACS